MSYWPEEESQRKTHGVEPLGAERLRGGAGVDVGLVRAGELPGDRLTVGRVPVGRRRGARRPGDRFDVGVIVVGVVAGGGGAAAGAGLGDPLPERGVWPVKLNYC